MTATTRCTCIGHPMEYCPMHGYPHDGIVLPLPLNPRGCDCFARKAELRSIVHPAWTEQGHPDAPKYAHAEIDPAVDPDVPTPFDHCYKCPLDQGTPCSQGPAAGGCAFRVPTEVDMVNHPPHYTSHPSGVESIEIKRHLGSDVGDAFKYVFRTELKNGRQDLEKAAWYLRDALDNGTACFLPSWNFEIDQKLDRVLDAEAHPNRLVFFSAIGRGNIRLALKAVEGMLDNG